MSDAFTVRQEGKMRLMVDWDRDALTLLVVHIDLDGESHSVELTAENVLDLNDWLEAAVKS